MIRKLLVIAAVLCATIAMATTFPTTFMSGKSTQLIAQTNYLLGSLGSGDSLTQAGTPTYFNSSGNLTTIGAANTARFDYNPNTLAARGWLVESSVVNGYFPSNSTPTSLGNVTITLSSTTGIDGTSSANTVTATSGSHQSLFYNLPYPTTAAANQTQSFYLKKGTWNFAYLEYSDWAVGNTWVGVVVNLNTGAITQTTTDGVTGVYVSSSVTAVNNGLYRVTFTGTLAVTSSYFILQFAPAATGNTFQSSTGYINSSSWAGTETMFYTAGQSEKQSFATSYIHTTSSETTRAADTAANGAWSTDYLMVEYELESAPGTISRASYCASGCTATSFSPSNIWIRRICLFNATAGGATAAQTAAGQANGTACS